MSENLKILVLNYEYPPVGGGGGIISKYISEGLAEKGHQVTVVTVWFDGLEESSQNGNIRIIRLKSKRKNTFRSNPNEMLSWVKVSKQFLNDFCQKETFDLCLANFAIPGGIVARQLKKVFNIPYVIISHGHDIPWVKPSSLYILHALNYFKIKSICTKSSAICVQSDMMKTNLEKFIGKTSKISLIPNGFDKEMFLPDYSKKENKLKILFSGRLVKQKDPVTFIEAITELKKTKHDFSVSIVGDGPLREKLEKHIKFNGLNSIVKILGKVPYEKVKEELQSAHILVSSSLSEGMSISLIEALACGIYTIVTPTSGTKELIVSGINGEYVDFKSPKQIADAIVDYYEDKYLNNYTVEPDFFNSFKDKYSWQSIVEQYHELIKSLKIKN